MAKDSRLELGRYIDYTKEPFIKQKKLNFDELFLAPASSGQYPWNPSRFTQTDLVRKMMTRKLSLNPRLNFVGKTPEQYEVFAGLPNFNRVEQYDFQNGRALTSQRPEEQPGFNSLWPDSYRLSPTIPAEKKIQNPMPRASNPDPRGYLMASAVKQVNNENQGNVSVAELMANKGSVGAPLSSAPSTKTYKENNEPPNNTKEAIENKPPATIETNNKNKK
jgi:hypothetical protein